MASVGTVLATSASLNVRQSRHDGRGDPTGMLARPGVFAPNKSVRNIPGSKSIVNFY